MSTVLLYTVCLLAVVLIGSRLDTIVRMTHRRTQLLMSLISGVLLGIAVFHLLPHAVYASGAGIDFVARFVMLGLLLMFLLQRVFHFHHHEYDSDSAAIDQESHSAHCEHRMQSDVSSHERSATAESNAGEEGTFKSAANIGVILGLSIHSVIDGFALGVSIQSDWYMGVGGLAGFGVFVAILLHKPLDALTLRFFMRESGCGAGMQWAILVGYGLICPLVVALIVVLSGQLVTVSPTFISAALGFSAGVFLCIALSDLLPEIHFHDHDRVKMTAMLLLGVLLSLGLGSIESEHRHGPTGLTGAHGGQSHDAHDLPEKHSLEEHTLEEQVGHHHE